MENTSDRRPLSLKSPIAQAGADLSWLRAWIAGRPSSSVLHHLFRRGCEEECRAGKSRGGVYVENQRVQSRKFSWGVHPPVKRNRAKSSANCPACETRQAAPLPITKGYRLAPPERAESQ